MSQRKQNTVNFGTQTVQLLHFAKYKVGFRHPTQAQNHLDGVLPAPSSECPVPQLRGLLDFDF